MGTKTFLGLHAITLGDFYQMAPVGDVNLWTDYFYIYSLAEIVWNIEQTGHWTQSDEKIYNSCKVKKNVEKYIWNVQHLFLLHKTKRKHNNYICTSTHTEKATIHAHHTISGNPCQKTRLKCLLMVLMCMKCNSNYRLDRILNVVVGHLY